jgi:hypothetical protein
MAPERLSKRSKEAAEGWERLEPTLRNLVSELARMLELADRSQTEITQHPDLFVASDGQTVSTIE